MDADKKKADDDVGDGDDDKLSDADLPIGDNVDILLFHHLVKELPECSPVQLKSSP